MDHAASVAFLDSYRFASGGRNVNSRESEESVSHWIAAAKGGDEEALEKLWKRYFETLVRSLRSRIAQRWRKARDEEDIAVSVFNSVWCGMQDGRLPDLNDRDDLWRILLGRGARKAATAVTHERRQKRGAGNVVGEADLAGTDDDDAIGLEQALSSDPTPESAVILAERCERLLGMLKEPRLREIACMKLEGYRNLDIAERFKCSLRTVERKLRLIRVEWSDVTPDED